MKLIIGLGNPGKEYQGTRHNVGFQVLDQLVTALKAPDFQLNKKFKAETSELEKAGQKIILVKPITFMNQSGEAVKLLQNFYKVAIEDIWVVTDELDLPVGTMRVKPDTITSTHNGIRSIIEQLGDPHFLRFRIGINNDSAIPADRFVLSKFTSREKNLISQVIEKTTEIVIEFIKKEKVKAETVDLSE